jgi:hypothetical protein
MLQNLRTTKSDDLQKNCLTASALLSGDNRLWKKQGLVLGSDHPFIIEKTRTIEEETNEKRCTHLLALSSDFSWVRVSENQ